MNLTRFILFAEMVGQLPATLSVASTAEPIIFMQTLLRILLASAIGSVALEAEVQVESDFPGGSVMVEELDVKTRTLRFRPMNHKGKGWACWWYFKVSGLTQGEVWKLSLNGSGFAAPARASVSSDGKTWKHTPPGRRSGKLHTYEVKVDAETTWFAWGPPFTLTDAQRLVENTAKAKVGAKAFTLCKSQDGHKVPALRWEPKGNGKQPAIWIQARQHAWEAGSSWVCQGLVEWLASDQEDARALRENARIYVVPIMDVDNVERGAGGKNQVPHDHNRDWSDQPRYPEVAAAQDWIQRLNEERAFTLFLDLHNPGPGDRKPFFFGSPDSHLNPKRRENQERFHAHCLGTLGKHPLGFSEKVRVTGAGYHPLWRRISMNWVAENTAPNSVNLTLETTWNAPHSTQKGYLSYGAALGQAIASYLEPTP
jgi:hypothetical protein